VVGLGQREGADCVQPRHRLEPARLLLGRAEQLDRLHREPGLDAEERPEAAVAAVELHVDESERERAQPGVEQLELGEPARERPRELGPLPVVVDDREHLLIDEPARAQERLPFGLVELLADEEVVGDERGAEHHVISGSASASAIAR
jgi:hypothetical protein